MYLGNGTEFVLSSTLVGIPARFILTQDIEIEDRGV